MEEPDIEPEPEPEPEAEAEAVPEAEPEPEATAEEAAELGEELQFEESEEELGTEDAPEYIADPLSDGEPPEDALGDLPLPPTFEEESLPEPGPEETSTAEPEPEPAPSETQAEEPLLGEPTARLLEYLKGLADELPPEAKEAFDVAGLKDKIDDLIGKIKTESERAAEAAAPRIHENGFGLLSAGEALRKASDPRRSAQGRRSGSERRTPRDRREKHDRRNVGERRGLRPDRRSGERRGPVPAIDLSEPIDAEAATVKLAADGTPTEIAGLTISPRMARLIEIMKREKRNAG